MRAIQAIPVVVLVGLLGATVPALAQQSTGRESTTAPTFSDLRAGLRVKVEGHMADDGSLVARRITLRDPRADIEIEGLATGVNRESRSLRLLGFDVWLSPAVNLSDGTALTDLESGQWLEVRGRWRGGRLEARRVRRRHPAPAGGEPELEAEIADVAIDRRELVLLGRRISSGRRLILRDQREGRAGTVADTFQRDDGELRTSGIPVGKNMVIGVRWDTSLRHRTNFDLDAERSDHDRQVGSGGRLDLSWDIRPRVQVFARSLVERDYRTRGDGWSASGELRVQEAHLFVRDVAGRPIDLRIGRQRVRDARGWLVDEFMDAVRLHVNLAPWRFEAAVARSLFAGPATDRLRREAPHMIASATRRLPRSTRVTGHLVKRYDRMRDEYPLWLGLMASGRVTEDWRYWTSVATRRGRAGSTVLGGWATEIGSTVQLEGTASPSLTVRYARGSGDRTPGDGVAGTFRQTALHSNQGKFDGFRWFDYYGEAFDPELSNLSIVTAAVTTTPRRSLSVSAIYHRFARPAVDRPPSSTRLDATLVPGEGRLGHELDAVVAWRRFGNTEISVVAGVFFPRAAFGPRAVPAFVWEPRVRVYF